MYQMQCRMCEKSWMSNSKEAVCECGSTKVGFNFVKVKVKEEHVTDTLNIGDKNARIIT